jgi:hypothetical protein
MHSERPLRIVWTWLDWWRVDHYVISRVNRIWTPALGFLGGLLVGLAPGDLNVFGNLGVVNETNGLIPILAGFFVASLAAVATFDRPGLDEVMGGIAPRLANSQSGTPERLTRRRFLCILFGYLAGASVALYMFGGFAMIAAGELHQVTTIPDEARVIARATFSAAYLGVLANITLTAFVGLYFLIERIHQDPPAAGFLDEAPSDDGDPSGG